jgi:hypothetical protein
MSESWRDRGARASQQSGRLWYAGFLAFLAWTLLGIASPHPEPAQALAAPPPEPVEPSSSRESYPPAAPAEATMADAVRLIETARDRYRDVRDYTCKLIQRERVGDRLPPETVMNMDVRTQPFSVHLKWLEPRSMAGQEAVYVAGRNHGNMRVKAAGLIGAVGFISLDVNDPRARRSSRHSITEAGMGNLIERFSEGWPRELKHGGAEVHINDFAFAGRPCTRVETIHRDNFDTFFMFERSVVYFDRETHLPIRVENYGWPKRAGAPAQLDEEYSYLNLRLNVGLTDRAFDY